MVSIPPAKPISSPNYLQRPRTVARCGLWPGAVRRDPFDAATLSIQALCRPAKRAASPWSCSPSSAGPAVRKMLFYHVKRHGTPVAPQTILPKFAVLFRGVGLHLAHPRLVASSSQRDHLTAGPRSSNHRTERLSFITRSSPNLARPLATMHLLDALAAVAAHKTAVGPSNFRNVSRLTADPPWP